jgi:hypothetical protein
MSTRTPSGGSKNANMMAAAGVLPLALSMLPVSDHGAGASTAIAQRSTVATGDFDGCPLKGKANSPTGNNPETNRQKNRSDTALNPEPITIAEMKTGFTPLEKPPATKRSSRNGPSDFDETITGFEAKQVVLTTYIVSAKATNAESCNCESTDPTDIDVHVYVNDDPEDVDHGDAAIVEVTPRWRQANPTWTWQNINALHGTGLQARITGWLLFDQEHWAMYTSRERGTLWEIHPITAIQVETKRAGWEDLSQYEEDQAAGDSS